MHVKSNTDLPIPPKVPPVSCQGWLSSRCRFLRKFGAVLGIYVLALLLAGASGLSSQSKSEKLATGTEVFGVGWTADSLSNVEVGRFPGRSVSYRFRAKHSGSITTLRVYFIFRKLCPGCYANGDGGKVSIQLFSDDGTPSHFPSRNMLGSAVVDDPMLQWNREVHLERPVSVRSGELYHIVFSNSSSDPVLNYTSVDDLYTTSVGSGLQPSSSGSDLAVLFKPNGTSPWRLLPQHVPILSIYYDDGYRQGQGYMDVQRDRVVVNDGDAVRELFTVQDTDHRVTSLAVRIDQLTNQGRLTVVVADHSGQPLETATFNLEEDPGSGGWKEYSWQQPLTLKKGDQYSVVLRAEEGSRFRVSPLQKGTQYGFEVDTLFTEGHCEVKTGPLWTECLLRHDLDIPFYFRGGARPVGSPTLQ